MAFRASPQHSSSELGSAFGLHLNSDLSIDLAILLNNADYATLLPNNCLDTSFGHKKDLPKRTGPLNNFV